MFVPPQALELAGQIYQKRDLGCKASTEPIVIQERKQDTAAGKKFWDSLGGYNQYQGMWADTVKPVL